MIQEQMEMSCRYPQDIGGYTLTLGGICSANWTGDFVSLCGSVAALCDLVLTKVKEFIYEM